MADPEKVRPTVPTAPVRRATLEEALTEQYKRTSGSANDPDGYLVRERRSTPQQRTARDLDADATQRQN